MKEEGILRPFFTWRSAVASSLGPPSSTTRLVLFCLSLHMNEQGENCFPSIDRLARESALSKKAVIDHITLAEDGGWIEKQERPERNGQGWRRMQYSPTMPPGIMAKVIAEKGGEPGLPPFSGQPEGGERGTKGGEPDGEKVVNDVHPSTSSSTSRGLPPKEKDQGQNRPAGPACAHCHGPLTGGHTSLRIGNVCNPCYLTYLNGEWSIEGRAA